MAPLNSSLGDNARPAPLKTNKKTLRHVCKLKGRRKVFVMQKLKKGIINRDRVPEKTMMMRFIAKVEGLAWMAGSCPCINRSEGQFHTRHNFLGPVQSENVGLLIPKLLRISRLQQKSIKSSVEPF